MCGLKIAVEHVASGKKQGCNCEAESQDAGVTSTGDKCQWSKRRQTPLHGAAETSPEVRHNVDCTRRCDEMATISGITTVYRLLAAASSIRMMFGWSNISDAAWRRRDADAQESCIPLFLSLRTQSATFSQ